MGKPSIFSSNYKQQMKRRRINVILIILIIISAAFFGFKYYTNKNNLKIGLFDKLKSISLQFKKEKAPENNIAKNNNSNTSVQPQTQTIKPSAPAETQKLQTYDYRTPDGRVFKVEYSVNGSVKEITRLIDASAASYFNISGDKKYIVFDDAKTNDIIIGDINGSFRKITRASYTSVSTGSTYMKDKILSSNPQYAWSRKPHFTLDNRVVYISQLPYFKRTTEYYLWVVNLDGSGHRKVGLVGNDLGQISYGSFDSQGNLVVKSGSSTYYFIKGGYELKK